MSDSTRTFHYCIFFPQAELIVPLGAVIADTTSIILLHILAATIQRHRKQNSGGKSVWQSWLSVKPAAGCLWSGRGMCPLPPEAV